jgi:glycerol-3-phosphate acyltransferase PlsX
MGAYPDAKAAHLVQFAVMGEVYVSLTRALPEPRVALLSNGAEDSKGTKEIKEAHELLRRMDLNFVGNVEGDQVFEAKADVIVCDGFAGNVLLKSAEGTALEIFHLMREEISKDFMARIGALAMMPALSRIRKRVDYEEYGGAPVLGVNNILINCHGRSGALAVKNAIKQASSLAQQQLTERIREALQQEDVEGRRVRLARAFHVRHE